MIRYQREHLKHRGKIVRSFRRGELLQEPVGGKRSDFWHTWPSAFTVLGKGAIVARSSREHGPIDARRRPTPGRVPDMSVPPAPPGRGLYVVDSPPMEATHAPSGGLEVGIGYPWSPTFELEVRVSAVRSG